MERNTPYKQLPGSEQIAVLDAYVRSAYFRRSRTLPDNLQQIVETLRQDILKRLADIPVGVLDEAITTSTLGDLNNPLSEAFFFDAAKKAWVVPKTNAHPWEGNADDDLAYWRSLRKELEKNGLQGTPQHKEACEMIEHYEKGDTEQDTISLLDTCAAMLKEMDDYERKGIAVAKTANVAGVAIPLPAFNSRREYSYLVMRRQLALNADDAYTNQAIQDVNAERIRDHHARVDKEKAMQDPDVLAQARRLAVLGWLRQCNDQGTTPSAILTPLINETQYRQLRKTV